MVLIPNPFVKPSAKSSKSVSVTIPVDIERGKIYSKTNWVADHVAIQEGLKETVAEGDSVDYRIIMHIKDDVRHHIPNKS